MLLLRVNLVILLMSCFMARSSGTPFSLFGGPSSRTGRVSKDMLHARNSRARSNDMYEETKDSGDSFAAMLGLKEDNIQEEYNEEQDLSEMLAEINKKLQMVTSGETNEDAMSDTRQSYGSDYDSDMEHIEKKSLKNLDDDQDVLDDIGNELADEIMESIVTESKDRFPKQAKDSTFNIEHNFNIEDDPVKITKNKQTQTPQQQPVNSVSQSAGQFLRQQQNFPQPQQQFQANNQFGNQQQYVGQFNNQQQYPRQGAGQFINVPQPEFVNNNYNGNNFGQQQQVLPRNGQYQGQNNVYQQQPQPTIGYINNQQQIQSQATPRQFSQKVDQGSGLLNEFGDVMGSDASTDPEINEYSQAPQLSPRQQADDIITNEDGSGDSEEDNEDFVAPVSPVTQPPVEEEEDVEEELRCINKVMTVEETVYEHKIKCQHTFTEKCHDTFITDYVPTQERKCETSFDKRCHIKYEPMMFEETVQICNEPLVKRCSNDTIGEEVCKTHYETTCETRFKEHTVEQDEPVCKMVIERKCNDVRVPVPGATGFLKRRKRQTATPQLTNDIGGIGPSGAFPELDNSVLEEDLLSIGEECEDWPVQKCTLEKKIVKKVNPDTSCQKMPREICAPSNCAFVKDEKVCRDETKSLIQNIPTEDCDIEPQEHCKMETVLVPRLVRQPNCLKVPKEICVNAKTNPKKVRKPVIKEWCYKPSDLKSPSTKLALSQFFSN